MERALDIVAELMALSARTAPKAAGKDYVVIRILKDDDIEKLAEAMETYGVESGKHNFDRDAANVRNSPRVLLVGLKDPQVTGLNCGACGVDRCEKLDTHEGPEFAGGLCAWRVLDLGIALGSAVKTASILNADNRIMYRIGVVARRIGLIDADIVAGVPIAATGKNIFFDRK